MRLEDDGGTLPSPLYPGVPTSARQSFRIIVDAANTGAHFRLPWAVDCSNATVEAPCACRSSPLTTLFEQ